MWFCGTIGDYVLGEKEDVLDGKEAGRGRRKEPRHSYCELVSTSTKMRKHPHIRTSTCTNVSNAVALKLTTPFVCSKYVKSEL